MVSPYVVPGVKEYDFLMDMPMMQLTAEDVFEAICRVYECKKDFIFNVGKRKRQVEAKHISRFFLSKFTNLSLSEIGTYFKARPAGNGRGRWDGKKPTVSDHTTIVHSRDTMVDLLKVRDERAIYMVKQVAAELRIIKSEQTKTIDPLYLRVKRPQFNRPMRVRHLNKEPEIGKRPRASYSNKTPFQIAS